MDDAVTKFKYRRAIRLRSRLDSDDDGKWVTTKKKYRVHINEEGVPDKGNPHVIRAMGSGKKAKATGAASEKKFYEDLYKWDKSKELNERNLKERRDKISSAVLDRTPSLKSCKSSRDVSEYLMAKGYFKVDPITRDPYGGVRVDPSYKCNLSTLSTEDAKKVGAVIEEMFGKYPKLRGKFYGIYATDIGGGHSGASEHTKGSVGINSEMFKDKQKLSADIEKDKKVGQHPPTDDFIRANIFHEYGHAIEGLLSGGREYGDVSDEILDKCAKKFGMKKIDVAREVGKYAAKTSMEFLAECFSEYLDSKKPRRIAKYVGHLVEEEMKKQGLL